MQYSKDEEQLIKEISEGNDESLAELFQMYQPIVRKAKKKYCIYGYDDKDLMQEARITCYESAKIFQKKRGKFGPYFRIRLHNRLKSLIRFQMAERRWEEQMHASFDELVVENPEELEHLVCESELLDISMDEIGRKFVPKLSKIELIAFLVFVGKLTDEEAIKKYQINPDQLKSARNRVYKKFLKALR